MSRLVAGLAALLVLASLFAGSTWGVHAPGTFLVGYDPKDADSAHVAITAAGGSVERSSPELGFAVVHASDGETFRRLATASPSVRYVEVDDGSRLDGAQWNGAQWNGAQWNGAQWNGAQWNGAQWNAMRDEGAQWNGAQWNAAQWTIQWTKSGHGKDWEQKVAALDPGLVWQWGVWATKADVAWATTKGSHQTRLCVLDSGLAWDHRDIAPNAWKGPQGERGYNAMDPAASPYDDAGHGTHVAGIAAAALANQFGISGVANVLILPVKVLDASGHGHESDLAFGLVWCANQGADVAVMALSITDMAEPDHLTLQRAFAYAAARDVLLLASAGNDGADRVSYPASDPLVLGVGAVDGKLAPAAFSNRGPGVDVAAPGVDMLGPLPGGVWAFGSGTSQAVGYAAGVAALVRDADASLTAAQAADVLRRTAQDIGAAGVDPATGHGLVRVDAAVQAALA